MRGESEDMIRVGPGQIKRTMVDRVVIVSLQMIEWSVIFDNLWVEAAEETGFTPYLLTKDDYEPRTIDGVEVESVPLYAFCLCV